MTPADLMPALRDHLTAELACHRSLLANAEHQQRELVANHLVVFADLVAKSEPLITEQARLRKAREKLLHGLAVLLDRIGRPLSLADVIAVAMEPIKGELASRHLVLKDTLMKLRAVQERNQALVRQGLGFVRDLVGTLTGESGPSGYDRRGREGSRTGNGRLVNLAG
ncbi:MAG TPA: flagellar protein FlgN [Planctomycetota bacterium]|jgi:flagellar biosynthesis/type III secretory pathway chaperone|nr:flagellar protein FlgN [Planctomycetota bacterium]